MPLRESRQQVHGNEPDPFHCNLPVQQKLVPAAFLKQGMPLFDADSEGWVFAYAIASVRAFAHIKRSGLLKGHCAGWALKHCFVLSRPQVLTVHPVLLDAHELFENFYYVAPREYLNKDRGTVLNARIQNLKVCMPAALLSSLPFCRGGGHPCWLSVVV
jgi:hypothetical protein